MPWVRIDEHAMSHPKIAGLSDGAFRLWVQALAHCQNVLTDGFVVVIALRGLSAYTLKRRTELVEAGLWKNQAGGGVVVHDYLQWNDSREQVLKARDAAKDRRRRWRDKDASKDASKDAGRTPTSPVRACVVPTNPVAEEREGGVGETNSERAGRFAQWYAEAHERTLGVGYIGPYRDYEHALRLCEKFSDTELHDAAMVWFGQDDDFATSGTRTIAKFASRASDCVLTARKVAARFSA